MLMSSTSIVPRLRIEVRRGVIGGQVSAKDVHSKVKFSRVKTEARPITS
jgi:hypothetical protein